MYQMQCKLNDVLDVLIEPSVCLFLACILKNTYLWHNIGLPRLIVTCNKNLGASVLKCNVECITLDCFRIVTKLMTCHGYFTRECDVPLDTS